MNDLDVGEGEGAKTRRRTRPTWE